MKTKRIRRKLRRTEIKAAKRAFKAGVLPPVALVKAAAAKAPGRARAAAKPKVGAKTAPKAGSGGSTARAVR